MAEGTALPGLPNTHHTSEGGKGERCRCSVVCLLKGRKSPTGPVSGVAGPCFGVKSSAVPLYKLFSAFTLCTLMCCLFIFLFPLFK